VNARHFFWVVIATGWLWQATFAQEEQKGVFLRVPVPMATNVPSSLDTSIVTYKKGDLTVALIGAVHIADPVYYTELNREFSKYDVVCYEMVAPEGENVADRLEARQQANDLATMLTTVVKMTFQFEMQQAGIDYRMTNLVHADMSPKEMAAAMRERGDSGITIALGVMADTIRQQNLLALRLERGEIPATTQAQEDLAKLDAIGVIKDPVKLKRVFAEQMSESIDGGLGATLERLLIDDRNSKAMEIVNRQIAKGHKKIGIFYGAAHMPDFETRLLRLGFKFDGISWRTAWDLRASKPSLVIEITKAIEALLDQ
jgi:hypothetical protein